MSGHRVAFAANASFGHGGQGEFLRLMAAALAGNDASTVYSRFVPQGLGRAINLPFANTVRAQMFNALQSIPVVRGRNDWLALLSDLDFDERVADAIEPPELFDGVMAQCATTIARLQGTSTRIVLTSLNTHIRHMTRVVDAEYRRVGAAGPSFIHPRMIQRALEEIAAADHIRVNSELAKTTFVDAGISPERVSVIYPGVDLAHFTPVEKRDDVFRVLAIASIDPRKGIQDVLQAFEDATLPNAELVIIGGTGDRWSKALLERYRSRLSNVSVRAVDVMTVPVAETFGPASVLVHAAVEDGFGLVVPQALACGRPVIVTRSSGAAELVQHGRNGFVVDPRSPGQITEYVRLLASDSSLREKMCASSRLSVEHLSYAAFASQTNALYATLLDR